MLSSFELFHLQVCLILLQFRMSWDFHFWTRQFWTRLNWFHANILTMMTETSVTSWCTCGAVLHDMGLWRTCNLFLTQIVSFYFPGAVCEIKVTFQEDTECLHVPEWYSNPLRASEGLGTMTCMLIPCPFEKSCQ